MTHRPPVPPEALADLVAARAEPFGVPDVAGTCPDEGTLAALAEERLADAEADAVAAHVVSCAACLDVVEAVRAAPRDLAPVRDLAAARVRRRVVLAVAAAVLLGLGAAVAWRAFEPAGPPSASGAELAWARLVARAPGLLAGARRLGPDELAADVAPLRGGVGLRGPAETARSDRPTFSWDDVPGAAGGTLSVVADDGREVWRRRVGRPPLSYPADAPALARGAAYVWSLALDAPRGRLEASRAFRVADATTSAAWDALVAGGAGPDAAAADLEALAHGALRLGLVEEAVVLAERAEARPDAGHGVAALAAHARARLAPRTR